MQRMSEWLTLFSQKIAVSGSEQAASSLTESLAPLCSRVWQTAGGSIIAVKKCGRPNARKILLDAHLDEVGLMVTEIDDNGFVHFVNHAGVDAKILPGTRVRVLGKQPLTGVIAAKPPHLLKEDQRKKPSEMKDMLIDIGLDKARAKQLVRTGDFIAFESACRPLLSNCISGKSLDNRAGMAVLVSLLELLQNRPLYADIYVVFSSGEEFGGYGAVRSAREIEPDKAIVLDVSHADTPTASEDDCGKLGKGVMIGISPVLDGVWSRHILNLARQNKIPHQIEAMSGTTSTNADNIVPVCGGIPTALLSIPLRYMHTPQEVVSLADMVTVRSLLLAVLDEEGKA